MWMKQPSLVSFALATKIFSKITFYVGENSEITVVSFFLFNSSPFLHTPAHPPSPPRLPPAMAPMTLPTPWSTSMKTVPALAPLRAHGGGQFTKSPWS